MDANIKTTDEYQRKFKAAAEYAVNKALSELEGRATKKAPISKSLGPNATEKQKAKSRPGKLKASGETTDAEWKGRELKGDVHFSVIYAAVQERGGWDRGPMAGVKIKNYSKAGTGKNYLKGSLEYMRPGYKYYLQKKMREKGIEVSI